MNNQVKDINKQINNLSNIIQIMKDEKEKEKALKKEEDVENFKKIDFFILLLF